MADAKDEKDEKKIQALRTFADDVKRIRSTEGSTERTADDVQMTTPEKGKESAAPPTPKAPELNAAEGSEEETRGEKEPEVVEGLREEAIEHTEPAVLHEHDTKTSEQTEPDAAEESEPLEAPPFHAIRASSPDDTTYGDTETEDIPDRETLQKETVRSTAPPQRSTTPIEGFEVDTEAVAEHAPSVHTNEDVVFDTEEAIEGGGGGTIVLDRKQDRFRLFPAIFSSLKKWFGTKKDEFEESRRPKHVVEKADRRRAVIEAASQESKRAPQDDFANVSDRLRDVERITTTDEVQIRDEEAATPQWRHVNDAEESAAKVPKRGISTFTDETTVEEADTAPETADATEASKAEAMTEEKTPAEAVDAAPAPREEEPIPISEVKERETAAPPPAEEATPTPAPAAKRTRAREEKTAETQPTPSAAAKADEIVPATEPRRSPESGGFAEYREKYGEEYNPREDVFGERNEPPPPGEAVSETRPRLPHQDVPEYRKQRVGQPRRTAQPQGTPYLTMIAVVVAAVILGVGTTVWWFTRDSAPTTSAPQPQNPALVNAQASVNVPLGNDREEFYTSLRGAIGRNAGGIVEFYPTVSEQPVSTERILQVLAWRAPGSMTRAVDSITFGGLGGEVPFIVMRFGSFDTVFGGMLAWEQAMSEDLAPLFGEGTITTSIDSRVNNRDIRVLVGPGGEDRIVYGFPDKNTLLITTNRNTYSTIAPEVQ